MLTTKSLLRLNVGFIVNQSIGYSRDFPFEIESFSISDDLIAKDLTGIIKISRTTQGLLVQMKGQAWVASECVFCLENFSQILYLDFVEIYTFPSHADENTDIILPDDLQIDFAPLIREYLDLEIPISPVCKPDCKGLCPICGENLNNFTCNHDEEIGDPRFAVLKTLLDNETNSNPQHST